MAKRDLPSLRIWHTLKYQAYDPADADAVIKLIRRTKPNNTNEYYGLIGLGEHVYLPMFDFPNRIWPYLENIVAEFMKIARTAAEQGYQIHEHTMSDWTILDLLAQFELLN